MAVIHRLLHCALQVLRQNLNNGIELPVDVELPDLASGGYPRIAFLALTLISNPSPITAPDHRRHLAPAVRSEWLWCPLPSLPK